MKAPSTVDGIRTLGERKAATVAAKTAAIGELHRMLAVAAPALGGRFILYGSAARGEIRHDSDVDILLDFPEERLAAAYDVVETACRRLDLPADLRPISLVSERFLSHVLAEAKVFQ